MLLRKRSEVDSELAAGITAGDPASFRTLLVRYKAEVHFLLARLAGEREANSLFEAVFLEASYALAAGKAPKVDIDLRSWLLQTAVELNRSHLNDRKEIRASAFGAPPPPVANLPYKGEVLSLFAAAELAKMELADREILALLGIRGLKRDDVSAICGLTSEEVKGRVANARAVLSERLRAHLGRGASYHCGDHRRCAQSRYCGEAERMFDDFIDLELDWSEKLTILSHLKRCRRCRMVLSDLNDIVTALKQPEVYPVPEELVEETLAAFTASDNQVS